MSYLSDEPTDEDMLWAEGYAYARAQVDDLEERNAKLVAAATRAVDAYQKADYEIEVINAMIALREALDKEPIPS